MTLPSVVGQAIDAPVAEPQDVTTGACRSFEKTIGKRPISRLSPEERCPRDGHLMHVVGLEGLHGFPLRKMYKPIVETLRHGFEAAHAGRQHFRFVDSKADEFMCTWQRVIARCSCGMSCTFVWIGIGLSPAWYNLTGVPALQRGGVRTVYYETEPPSINQPCHWLNKGFDEVWTYTHMHSHHCSPVKYFPPGFVPSVTVDTGPTGEKAFPPAFFGWLVSRTVACSVWEQFSDVHVKADIKLTKGPNGTTHGSLAEVYNVWTEDDFKRLATRHNSFVNAHRSQECLHQRPYSQHHNESRANCEAFRMSQLLSMGSFVVSERCNPEDESNFHGIVEFPLAFRQIRCPSGSNGFPS